MRVAASVGLATLASLASSVVTARGLPVAERGEYIQLYGMAQALGYLGGLSLSQPVLGLSGGAVPASRSLLRSTLKFAVPTGAVACLLGALATGSLVASVSGSELATLATLCATLIALSIVSNRMVIPRRVGQEWSVVGTSQVIPVAVPLLSIMVYSSLASLTIQTAMVSAVLGHLALIGYLKLFRSRSGPAVVAPLSPSPSGGRVVWLGLQDVLSSGPALILGAIDVIVVGVLLGAADASIYAVAKTLANSTSLITAVVVVYFGPRYAGTSNDARYGLMTKSLKGFGAASLLTAIVLASLAALIVPTVFGEAYSAAIAPGRILLAASALQGISAVLMVVLRVSLNYGYLVVVVYISVLISLGGGSLAILAGGGLIGFSLAIAAAKVVEVVLLALQVRVPRANGQT